MRGKSILGLAVIAGLSIAPAPAGAQLREPVTPALGQIPTVTLEDAIGLALRSHTAIVRANADLSISHASQRVALASWLPNLNVSSSATRNASSRIDQFGVVRVVPTPYSGSLSINANMVVWDWFRRGFQGRQANASAARDEANLVSQKFSVTLQTKQAFFGALAAADLERVALTAVQRAEEQLKIAREKLIAGSAVRSDTLQATVALGTARLSVLTAQTQRANQEATLARLIGYDRPVRAVGDSSAFAITSIDTTGIRAEAMQGAPGIAAAEANVRSTGAAVNIARSQYLPTLTGNYSNSRSASDSSFSRAFGNLNPTWNVSVSLNFPIFDRLQREQGLWNANANRDAAEAASADARRNVNAQVTQYLAALQAAEQRVYIARASREAAFEATRVQRERYRLGAATIVEVLTAQEALDRAESDGINARVDYQVAKANLSALVGREL